MKTTLRNAVLGSCLGLAAQTHAAPERTTAADVKAMLKSISDKRIEATIRKLVSFGTRHTLSDTASNERGIGAARRWIKAQLDECAQQSGGRLKVENDSFIAQPNRRIAQPTELINVVATLRGDQAESADRIYIVSGHYDSMPSNVLDPTSDVFGLQAIDKDGNVSVASFPRPFQPQAQTPGSPGATSGSAAAATPGPAATPPAPTKPAPTKPAPPPTKP